MKKYLRIFLCMAFALIVAVNLVPEKALAEEIRLGRTNITLLEGKSTKLQLKGAEADKVKWSVSDSTVISVTAVKGTNKGKIKALKAGTSIVTATYDNISFGCMVTVTYPTIKCSLTGSYVTNAGKVKTLELNGKYTGPVNDAGLPEGLGTFTATAANGTYTYKGYFENGALSGKGTVKYGKKYFYGTFVKGIYTPTFGDTVYSMRKKLDCGSYPCTEELAGIIDINSALSKKQLAELATEVSYLSLLNRSQYYKMDIDYIKDAKIVEVRQHSYCGCRIDEIIVANQNEEGKNQYYILLFNNQKDRTFKVGKKINAYASPVETLKWTNDAGKEKTYVREIAYIIEK